MVVEARPLPGKPAQQPDLMIVAARETPVPAPVRVVPDEAEPFLLMPGGMPGDLRQPGLADGGAEP